MKVFPVEPGAYAVMVPVVFEGKVIGVFPSPVIAFQLSDEGVCVGIVTILKVHEPGVAIWTPEGSIEAGDDVWGSPQEYLQHLQKTLLH